MKTFLEVLALLLALTVIFIGVPLMIVIPEIAAGVVGIVIFILLFIVVDNKIQKRRDRIYGSRFIRRP